jgi:hypothetical protein
MRKKKEMDEKDGGFGWEGRRKYEVDEKDEELDEKKG